MERELLFSITKKDLILKYFSGTGKGGQHRNKHQNCVRLQHPDSGVSVTGQSHKSMTANKKEALHNLVKHPKFKVWHTQRVNEILRIEDTLDLRNLKIEVRKKGRWELYNEDLL